MHPTSKASDTTSISPLGRSCVQGGFLYPCRCSRKDLAAALSAPHESAAQSRIPSTTSLFIPAPAARLRQSLCALQLPRFSTENPTGMNWRFRVPDGETIQFDDLNLGPQRYVAGVDFGDFVVWRRDGVPSYQLACVADDAEMRITEVVRGADLLKSTARQILLNRALGFRDPAWYHCDLITDQNGVRLAKRHDALSIRTLRERGLTPDEVIFSTQPKTC